MRLTSLETDILRYSPLQLLYNYLGRPLYNISSRN